MPKTTIENNSKGNRTQLDDSRNSNILRNSLLVCLCTLFLTSITFLTSCSTIIDYDKFILVWAEISSEEEYDAYSDYILSRCSETIRDRADAYLKTMNYSKNAICEITDTVKQTNGSLVETYSIACITVNNTENFLLMHFWFDNGKLYDFDARICRRNSL